MKKREAICRACTDIYRGRETAITTRESQCRLHKGRYMVFFVTVTVGIDEKLNHNAGLKWTVV